MRAGTYSNRVRKPLTLVEDVMTTSEEPEIPGQEELPPDGELHDGDAGPDPADEPEDPDEPGRRYDIPDGESHQVV